VMGVEDATSGTRPASRRQQRNARATRDRETRAHSIRSWEMAEEDTEAAIRWTQRTLQDHAARHAMTASLDLWMWPSDGQDSAGTRAGGPGTHETMFDPVARGGLHATGSAGGDDHAEIAILGDSGARSERPYDDAVHTMQEADVPSSRPVRGEPPLGGCVEVGVGALQDGGNGMALDSVTDTAVDGVGARSGVGGLGSGQGRLGEGVHRAVLSAPDGVSARYGGREASSQGGRIQDFDDRLIRGGADDTSGGGGPGGGTPSADGTGGNAGGDVGRGSGGPGGDGLTSAHLADDAADGHGDDVDGRDGGGGGNGDGGVSGAGCNDMALPTPALPARPRRHKRAGKGRR